ncbi:hypothetical protein VTO42DRAFT_486 [Malbranchea cinnamomea]
MSRSSMDSTRSSAGGPSSPQSTALSSPPLDPVDPDPAPAPSTHLDDIFGSSPPGFSLHDAVLAPASTTAITAATTAEDAVATNSTPSFAPRAPEPSDLPSLRRQHVTAGYRDGVSAAKMAHVQEGFDKGYPVGAELGLRVGIVLGVLEGIVTAMKSRGEGDVGAESGKGRDKKRERDMRKLYETAKKELAVQSVFGEVARSAFADDEEEHGLDVKERLARAGELVVAKWEDRVREILAETS